MCYYNTERKKKNMKKKHGIGIVVLLILAIFVVTVWLGQNKKPQEDTKTIKIVTSFEPIYSIAKSLTKEIPNIIVETMAEKNVGCLHDYTLTTADMKKIEKADIFIQNGLGLENFMDRITSSYPNLKIIDSSTKITNLATENEEVNPHIWTNITNYIEQTKTICEKLIEYTPEYKEEYQKNCENYLAQLENLKSQYESELQNLKGKKVICLNEALTYLAKELQIEAVTVETDHEESTLSADTIKNLIDIVKNENIQMIWVGKEDSIKNAQTLAKETNAQIYTFDTILSHQENQTYVECMKNNLEVLKSINGKNQ